LINKFFSFARLFAKLLQAGKREREVHFYSLRVSLLATCYYLSNHSKVKASRQVPCPRHNKRTFWLVLHTIPFCWTSNNETVNTNFLSLLIWLDKGLTQVFRLRGERSQPLDHHVGNIYFFEYSQGYWLEQGDSFLPALLPRGGSIVLCFPVR